MESTKRLRMIEGVICLLAFVGSIPFANWLIGNVGTECVPQGPCVIPVFPGITAPSGVLVVGLAFVVRDLLQRRLGLYWAIGGIAAGGLISALFAAPSLVLASTAAFLLSEIADLFVYTPLQRRGFVRAAVASSVVGLIVDSVVFLGLAFGSLDFLAGQVLGKTWMVALAIPVLLVIRERDRRLGLMPA
jgi:uncharacterized PurR-regulated membrane protein YhhQ (DUF165 family)